MTQGQWVRRVIKPAVFVLALGPFAELVRDAFTGGLGTNPVERVTHWTGFTALTFLLLTLSVTPLQKLLRLNALIQVRRMLGLYAFFYACLHFSTYAVDQTVFSGAGLSLDLIVEDVMKRPYITLGFTAFVLLWPLALTSTNGMLKRLGAARWKALHRLVYFAAAGGAVHYLWKGKMEEGWAVVYGLVLVALLAWRLVVGRVGARRGATSRSETPLRAASPAGLGTAPTRTPPGRPA